MESEDQTNMANNDPKTMIRKQWAGSKQRDTMISEVLCPRHVCALPIPNAIPLTQYPKPDNKYKNTRNSCIALGQKLWETCQTASWSREKVKTLWNITGLFLLISPFCQFVSTPGAKRTGTNKEKLFPAKRNENLLRPLRLFIERKFNVWISMKANSFVWSLMRQGRVQNFEK